MKTLILLNRLTKGNVAIIRKFEGETDLVHRLREHGFAEGMQVTKFSDDASRTIVIIIQDRKMCLSELAAKCILVELT